MTDYQSAHFPPPESTPFQPTEQTKPQQHPEVTKRCNDYIYVKLKVIANAPISAEEKTALAALVNKSVVKLMQKEMPEVEKGLTKLDQQIWGYRKVNMYIIARIKEINQLDFTEDQKTVMAQKLIEGGSAILRDIKEGHLVSIDDITKKIAAADKAIANPEEANRPIRHSPRSETTQLHTLEAVRKHDKQLDPQAEKLTNQHATMALNMLRRISMSPENRLLLSKLIQEQVVNLRHQYRHNAIDLQGYEAGLKAIKDSVIPLAKDLKIFDQLQKAIQGFTESHYLRENLAISVDHSLHEIREAFFPTKESVAYLIQAAKKESEFVVRVHDFITNREEDFAAFEKDLFQFIQSSPISPEKKEELYEMYDRGIAKLIELAGEGKDDIALEIHLVTLTSQIYAKIDTYMEKG